MDMKEMEAIFTRMVKTIKAERGMREYVFKNKPAQLTKKLAEMDQLLADTIAMKDALKALLPADPGPGPVQATLLDAPKQGGY